ncbi:hypothetical protein [Salinispira pacifica]
MERPTRRAVLILTTIGALALVLAGCSSNGSTAPTKQEVRQAMSDSMTAQSVGFSSALSAGYGQSSDTGGSGGVTWDYTNTGNTITITITFNNYTYNGITLNGTIGITMSWTDIAGASNTSGQYDSNEPYTATMTGDPTMSGAAVHSLHYSLNASYDGSSSYTYTGSITADGTSFSYSGLFS